MNGGEYDITILTHQEIQNIRCPKHRLTSRAHRRTGSSNKGNILYATPTYDSIAASTFGTWGLISKWRNCRHIESIT